MPVRTKIYPDTTFEKAARARGAHVICCWEMRGPKNTGIAWVTCYMVNGMAAIVETFKEGGWDVFTPGAHLAIDATVDDALVRCQPRRMKEVA